MVQENNHNQVLLGREPPLFNILSGMSMACLHVSSLAVRIKVQHPTWSPSAINQNFN